MGEVPSVAFSDGRVLGHEGVQPERVDALGLHLARLGARSTLVALMFRADDDVRKVVEATTETTPLRRFGAADLEQTVWRVEDADVVARLRERLDDVRLYITDGHHRATASVELWEDAGRPGGSGVPAVLFPTPSSGCSRSIDGSSVRCRSVSTSCSRSSACTSRSRRRTRSPTNAARSGLYVAGRWFRLVPEPSTEAEWHRWTSPASTASPRADLRVSASGGPGLEFVSDAVPS